MSQQSSPHGTSLADAAKSQSNTPAGPEGSVAAWLGAYIDDPRLTPSQRRIARFFVEETAESRRLSLTDLAKRIGVSPSS